MAEDPVCDFCGAKPVRYSCPARNTVMAVVAFIVGNSIGNWAACGPCGSLILRSDREGLARRSAVMFRRKRPDLHDFPVTQKRFREIHDQFWSAREGRPVYLGRKYG